MISDDLVNSYHLLLCALDLVYGNALQCSNRKELVNPNFKGKFVNQSLLDNSHFYTMFALGCCRHSTGFPASANLSALKSSIVMLSRVLMTRSSALCKNIYGKSSYKYCKV